MSEKRSMPRPVRIKAPHGAKVMHIDWSDGHHGVYPHEILRGFCPCADCQGHSGEVTFKEGGNLEILDIQTVGNYAISITWGDGHNAGIYNFDYLRSLCWCSECHPEGLPSAGAPLPSKTSGRATAEDDGKDK